MAFKERRKKPRKRTDAKDKGHETDYIRHQEFEFKTVARRNKLLGLRVAEKLGMTGAAAEAYGKEVVAADFEEPGHDGVVRKVMKDLAEKGADLTEDQLRQEMDALLEIARTQIKAEQP